MNRILVSNLLVLIAFASFLFIPAGRIDLPFYWAYLVTIGILMIVSRWAIDPDLARERVTPAPGGIDRNLGWALIPFFAGHVIVGGLDVGRFHWSDGIPAFLRIGAFVLMALSLALSTWAMHINRFFSPVVRIQSERGHRVVTTGLYAWVRHPGYAAALVMLPTSAMVLGSWLSLVTILPAVGLIVRRMVIEDRYLCKHLPGYSEYAEKVPYWIVPGLL